MRRYVRALTCTLSGGRERRNARRRAPYGVLLMLSGAKKTLEAHNDCPYLGHRLVPKSDSVTTAIMTGPAWVMDNGAFSGFDVRRFCRHVAEVGPDLGCRFVVAPPIPDHPSELLGRVFSWASIRLKAITRSSEEKSVQYVVAIHR
jgi:hypothetical protein